MARHGMIRLGTASHLFPGLGALPLLLGGGGVRLLGLVSQAEVVVHGLGDPFVHLGGPAGTVGVVRKEAAHGVLVGVSGRRRR